MANLGNITKIGVNEFNNTEYTYDEKAIYMIGGGPVLLWRSEYPNSERSSQTVDLPNTIIKYKYLKFYIACTSDTSDGVMEFVWYNPIYNEGNLNKYYSLYCYWVDTLGQVFLRYITLTYDSSQQKYKMDWSTGRLFYGSSLTNPYNAACTPLEIWGSNSL